MEETGTGVTSCANVLQVADANLISGKNLSKSCLCTRRAIH